MTGPNSLPVVKLLGYLGEVAHRMSTAWPWQVGIATSMTYDGTFGVETSLFIGLADPRPGFYSASTPPHTGMVLLLGIDGGAAVPRYR